MPRAVLWSIAIGFVIALCLQGVLWSRNAVVDIGIWAHQGEWLMSGNPEVFDFGKAYAHPGGTVVEGVLLLSMLGVSGETAVTVLISMFNAVVITLCVWLCHQLRRDWWWTTAVILILSLHTLYLIATPTTALAAPLVVLLCLSTIALYEKKWQPSAFALAGWGAIVGLAVATRADIGVFSSACFGALLLTVLPWTRLLFAAAVALAIFVIANPFMWFMPVQHMYDLIHKITWHYADFAPSRLSFVGVLQLTLTSWISMSMAAVLWWKNVHVIPTRVLVVLYAMTAILFTVFLTSQYQAARYFMPIVFIWDVLLPLFLLSALPLLAIRKEIPTWLVKIGVLGLVVLPHVITFVWMLLRPYIYFI